MVMGKPEILGNTKNAISRLEKVIVKFIKAFKKIKKMLLQNVLFAWINDIYLFLNH